MRKRVVLGIFAAAFLSVAGLFAWNWFQGYSHGEIPAVQDLDRLTFETIRPGLEVASAVSSEEVPIGEEFTVFLWVRYDPARFRLDGESIRNSRIAPFEIRSVSSTLFRGEKTKETVQLFETRVQCVTCPPDNTFRFAWPILRYEDIVSGDPYFIQIRFLIREPYLFNPAELRFRSFDTDHKIPVPVDPAIPFGGGLFLLALAVLVLVLFMRGWERTRKAALPLRPHEELWLRIQKSRDALSGGQECDFHKVLDEMYFALGRFTFLEHGEDVMQRRGEGYGSSDEFSRILMKTRKAYTKEEITSSEVSEILDEIEACLLEAPKRRGKT